MAVCSGGLVGEAVAAAERHGARCCAQRLEAGEADGGDGAVEMGVVVAGRCTECRHVRGARRVVGVVRRVEGCDDQGQLPVS